MNKVWELIAGFWRPALGGLLAAGVVAGGISLVVGRWPMERVVPVAITSIIVGGALFAWAWRMLAKRWGIYVDAVLTARMWAEIESGTGLVQIHGSLEDAIGDIQEQLATSQRQYVFAQLGREVFHTSSKLSEIIFESKRPDNVDLRILHASKTSRYLSRPVAIARKADFDQWQNDLNYMIRATPKVSDAGGQVRQHREPFLWRLFIFDSLCFVQPYVATRNNGRLAKVLVFNKDSTTSGDTNPMSLYKIFEKYFEAIWEENTPHEIAVADLDKNSGRLVVVGLIQDGLYSAWAVPHRYFSTDEQTIRFNGIGGKSHPGEHPIMALERELREELGEEFNIKSSDRTIFASEGRVVTRVSCTDEVKPVVINKFERYENLSSESVDYHLVAYSCGVNHIRSLTPHNDLGAVLVLSKKYLRRAVAGNLTIGDVLEADDGSCINTNLDLSKYSQRKLAPAGLALVYANEAPLEELH